MKICFLTQTASDISPFYKEYFKHLDLFFITFKKFNPSAVGFYPNSTWSDGRNRLWDFVKDKYDYYIFIDDDLEFFLFDSPVNSVPIAAYAWYRLMGKSFLNFFKSVAAISFVERLIYYLDRYKPEVASVINLSCDVTTDLATALMRKNSFVKRLGHFDAQFTIFSQYAASKMLPYDSSISGWWSAQIPIYLYAHHVFRTKAIAIGELGVKNTNVQANYRPNYDGIADCKLMLAEISKATGKDFTTLAGGSKGEAVDMRYGADAILRCIPVANAREDYAANYANSLLGLENLCHLALLP